MLASFTGKSCCVSYLRPSQAHIYPHVILSPFFFFCYPVNNARLRLLRLSEAAEKLRRQAALSIHKGKENDARELLFQKRKIMEALDKSKNRIELLDELSLKLNEVELCDS